MSSLIPRFLQSSWTPILDGESKALAEEAIRAIAHAIRNLSASKSPHAAAVDGSLAVGSAGLAMLYAALAESGLVDGAEEIALEFLNESVEMVATVRSSASLYGGFTGTAWAMDHLEGWLFDADDGDPNESVDEALRELLSRSPWRGDYDVVNGLVGFGVYALERLPRPSAIECLDLVLDRLEEMAEHTAQGVTWFTGPKLLFDHQLKEFPGGYYNLGLAHGVPGVIALLGQVCASDDEKLHAARYKARALLDGAVAWLLAQQPADRAQCFPSAVGPGITPKSTRLAWGYGDLGIAVALLGAARGAREPAWEQEAMMIARRAAARPVEKSGVVDCGLCRGAAGAGHLFNRLFQASGDEMLWDAARFWFARTLEMRKPGEAVAGFPAWMPDPERPEDKRWVAEPGILEGASGVALALLAATTDIEPEWDRMMLVSIPGGKSR